MKIKINKKYFAIFTVNQNDVQNVVGFKRFNPTDTKISFKGRTFIPQIEFPSYIKGRKLLYFFNLKDGQLLFNKTSNESIINPQVIDTILTKSIINQLTANLNNKWKVELPLLLFAAVFGGVTGFLVAGYV